MGVDTVAKCLWEQQEFSANAPEEPEKDIGYSILFFPSV
jgi:hypothetical protein